MAAVQRTLSALPRVLPVTRLALARNRSFAPQTRPAEQDHVLPPPPAHREVFNQSLPFEDVNLFTSDAALVDCVKRLAPWAVERATAVGQTAGSADFARLAEQANANMPRLRTHDSRGRRIDVVEFHPAYHQIMAYNVESGLTSLPWTHRDQPNAHVARNALGFMLYQAESGTQCPITMTFAAFPALQHMTSSQAQAFDWAAKATSLKYDPRNVPASEKAGVTIGMSMTERQGGSDVRANTTYAEPLHAGHEGPGSGYLLNGHKWFTSAPMCDAFLTLANTKSGLSCFIVPRWLPTTGERNNGLVFMRLKEKLGDRSNASSEVEYHNAYGELLGEEGRGIATILQMVHHTRLDCTVGSAGLMRRCVAEALFHTQHRAAFGSTLNATPIMQAVLADLSVESEAATLMAMRVASTFGAEVDEQDKLLSRIGTAVAKYHVCKRLPFVSYESMECLGGNGYVDDSSPMPRFYRQAPLNAIWEGSGNVICLDVLRAMSKEPNSVSAFFAELSKAQGMDARLDEFVTGLQKQLGTLHKDLSQARLAVSMMATAWQAALLLQHGNEHVAEAFCATRLVPGFRPHFGCLPSGLNLPAIIDRATPHV